MKAFRLNEWQKGASWEEVSTPEPRSGQVLIRVGAAGACHSDLHLMHEWTPESFPGVAHFHLPFTLGHENAGWVEADASGEMEPGTPVVVSPTWNCGVCRPCRNGATNYCESELHQVSGGLGLDGGIAEYMVVPSNTLVRLVGLEPWRAAPLTDAGLTSYHAAKGCLPLLTPDTAAVIIGVGGLGHFALEFLRELCGATLIAVDVDEKALALAAEQGAHITLPSDETAAGEIRKATRGLGATAVLDFVGVDATLALAAQAVRKLGRIVVVGIGGGTLPLQYGALPMGASVTTILGGSTGELAEVVALAEADRIHPRIEKFPMEEATKVYEQLHEGKITGRAVLTP